MQRPTIVSVPLGTDLNFYISIHYLSYVCVMFECAERGETDRGRQTGRQRDRKYSGDFSSTCIRNFKYCGSLCYVIQNAYYKEKTMKRE